MDVRLLLARLAASLLLPVGAAAMPSVRGAAASPSEPAVQLAKAGGSYNSVGRSYKGKESESGWGEDEPTWSHSTGVKVPGQSKSNPSGYSPERVQRFWRLYHGARRPSKEDKPKRTKEPR